MVENMVAYFLLHNRQLLKEKFKFSKVNEFCIRYKVVNLSFVIIFLQSSYFMLLYAQIHVLHRYAKSKNTSHKNF